MSAKSLLPYLQSLSGNLACDSFCQPEPFSRTMLLAALLEGGKKERREKQRQWMKSGFSGEEEGKREEKVRWGKRGDKSGDEEEKESSGDLTNLSFSSLQQLQPESNLTRGEE